VEIRLEFKKKKKEVYLLLHPTPQKKLEKQVAVDLAEIREVP
jgi:hypothetical protein